MPDYMPLRSSLLPSAEAIQPYLEAIDKKRWYSNHGPLVRSLEERLKDHFGGTSTQIHLVSSGTTALTLSLMSIEFEWGGPTQYCMLPAYTFAASAIAIRQAGLEPWFVDVDQETWSLTPEIARRNLSSPPGPVAAVMPVSVFGAPLPYKEWDEFRSKNGIDVVIDSAWSFDTLEVTNSLACLSLHATKVFGIGEGGVVTSSDSCLVESIRQAANFGFDDERVARIIGLNGKLSEFSAAVGHAVLDAWPKARTHLIEVMSLYYKQLSVIEGVTILPGFDGTWASAALAIRIEGIDGKSIVDAMRAEKIEARSWWNIPLSRHLTFSECPAADLTMTEYLCRYVVNIPVHHTMTLTDVDRVCSVIEMIASSTDRAAI